MKNGKFIVIDGLDGSGKGTQFEILTKKLKEDGYDIATFDFPQYGQKSAALVEEYLNGNFGTAEEVSPYAGATFYAVDRYAAAKEIKNALAEGKIVLSNRYVSASKGHQAAKIADQDERLKFIDWLNDLEYSKLEIPVPDITILLYVPYEVSSKLILKKPAHQYLEKDKQDIHENDIDHLKKAEAAYLEMADGADKMENWVKIACCKNGEILPRETITGLILDELKNQNLIN